MRAVVQRVSRAEVRVEGRVVGKIARGLLVYLGVGAGDAERDGAYIAEKVAGLRVFEDDARKMNLDVKAVGGGVLLISQFTLYGDVRKGRRPSFDGAMEPVRANALYEDVAAKVRALGVGVETGTFRADMEVDAVNDGPVTVLLDSGRLF